MSLFDVIKYPISSPPTLDEFRALPRDLLIQWMSSNGFEFDFIDYPSLQPFNEREKEIEDAPRRAFSVYRRLTAEEELKELSNLRQMIKELP